MVVVEKFKQLIEQHLVVVELVLVNKFLVVEKFEQLIKQQPAIEKQQQLVVVFEQPVILPVMCSN